MADEHRQDPYYGIWRQVAQSNTIVAYAFMCMVLILFAALLVHLFGDMPRQNRDAVTRHYSGAPFASPAHADEQKPSAQQSRKTPSGNDSGKKKEVRGSESETAMNTSSTIVSRLDQMIETQNKLVEGQQKTRKVFRDGQQKLVELGKQNLKETRSISSIAKRLEAIQTDTSSSLTEMHQRVDELAQKLDRGKKIASASDRQSGNHQPENEAEEAYAPLHVSWKALKEASGGIVVNYLATPADESKRRLFQEISLTSVVSDEQNTFIGSRLVKGPVRTLRFDPNTENQHVTLSNGESVPVSRIIPYPRHGFAEIIVSTDPVKTLKIRLQ